MSVKYNKVKLFKYGDKGYDLIHLPDGTFVNENGSKKRYDYFSDYEDGIYEISRKDYIEFYIFNIFIF